MRIAAFAFFLATALPATAKDITFDIYGIQIGDTFEDVERAMSTAGFELQPELGGDIRYQRSFEDQRLIRVGELEASEAERTTPKKATYSNDDKGLIGVHFTAWPDGAAVTDVHFYLNEEFLDCDTFTEASNEKFGHGIQVDEGWTDTADEPDGSITVWVDCGSYGFNPKLHLFMRRASQMHTELLSQTDPEPELDF